MKGPQKIKYRTAHDLLILLQIIHPYVLKVTSQTGFAYSHSGQHYSQAKGGKHPKNLLMKQV